MYNVATNTANIDGNFWKGLGYFGIGVLSGAARAYVGGVVDSGLSISGLYGASGTFRSSFFASGAIADSAAFTSGFINGFGNSLINEQNIGDSFLTGITEGGIYGISGFIFGGIIGGIDAAFDKRNFWHGGVKLVDKSINISKRSQKENTVNCNHLVASANAEYYGVEISAEELLELQPIKDKYGLTDQEIAKLYGKAGFVPTEIKTKDRNPIDIVTEIANTIGGTENNKPAPVQLNVKTGIHIDDSGKKVATAHATSVTRVKIYDNNRYVIKIMNPLSFHGGSSSYRNTNSINLLIKISTR